MQKFTIVVCFILLLGVTTDAAKILALFLVPVKSHFGSYQPLLEELAKRGHEMKVVSSFPRKVPLKNYIDMVIEDTLPPRGSKELNTFEIGKEPFLLKLPDIFRTYYESCEKVLKLPKMQELINSNEKFDLILYEPFFTECSYGLIHKFKSPSIQLVPNSNLPWAGNPVGNPSTASYIPEMITGRDKLDFMGRMTNFLTVTYLQLFRNFYYIPKMEAILRKHFPDPTLPSIEELEAQASFLFLHSHPVLNHPRPLTPNTIEVGGLHIKEPGKLPQDLQKVLDEATDGAIYFSLGSHVRSADMPDDKRNALIKTFSKLKQKVLWKWETDSLPGQPKNVLLRKWFPQNDILAHPNVKLFITHGGLMSTQEATYFGMPLIAIPVFADQMFNAIRAQNAGYAIVLNIQNITQESASWALREVLYEPRYRENAKQLSNIFRDQPQKPLDRAVYWIDYTIRHKGASHFKSAAVDLNVFQYYLLDVIAFLILLGLIFVVVLTFFVRKVTSRLCSRSKNAKSVSRSKKQS